MLYQIQNAKPELIAYGSERLPEAAKTILLLNYSYVGLAISIANFSHRLKGVDCDAIMDHL